MTRITINDAKFSAIHEHNAGYDTTMMMREWDDSNWEWWAFQVKRIGLQAKISAALAKWDDDNSTGMVSRRVADAS